MNFSLAILQSGDARRSRSFALLRTYASVDQSSFGAVNLKERIIYYVSIKRTDARKDVRSKECSDWKRGHHFWGRRTC